MQNGLIREKMSSFRNSSIFRTKYVIEICGCKPYWANVATDKVEECDAFEILDCAGPAEAHFASEYTLAKCGCAEPCQFVTFDTEVTYSTFPSIEVARFLTANTSNGMEVIYAGAMNLNFMKSVQDVAIYRGNHLMLDIHFDTLSYVRTSQTKSDTEISLISDIGGLMGLWLGISFVTLFEFFQLLLLMVCGVSATSHDNRVSQLDTRSLSLSTNLPITKQPIREHDLQKIELDRIIRMSEIQHVRNNS
ncbi:unnamed protein product [Clavelina lepadiformis]|uniref:Uncharacterized protein n=1 Tax=Clavelina lepadiformis TaxID=159417 RepID=A0ABP0GZ83_CLALP